jgi:hypothetical protein
MSRKTECRKKEFLEAEFLRNTEGTHWIMAPGPKPRSSFVLRILEFKNKHLSESERNKKLKEESKEEELLVTRVPLRPMSFAINHLIDQLSEEYLSESKSRK